jgi:hypothetical protein
MSRIAVALAAALAVVAVVGCTPRAQTAPQPPQTPAPAVVETPAAEAPSAEPTPAEPSAPATVAPKPKPKPKEPTEAELRAAAGAVALEAAKDNSDEAAVGKLSVASVRIARDNKGKWWGIAVVRPSKTNVDAANVLLERTSSGWKAFDLGTGIGPQDERFPAEVRERLE